ncbi:hypothetical protein CN692_23820 [Bacillus sp. AFS002410]|uniref:hypothetical protein n=1 Tax=Bacillus sp. AFS002410 TaxID=2033481 RepID=UPI000BEF3FC1|nr:hypothetical protein [Bacillus sp. AFS002410]PEJ48487.1 hypothetical protein CN692_23820 [Bacillus sp. AFS002410]
MIRKVNLHQDEFVLSTITGLVEIFDGMQNIYYGDLFLTNKRLFIESNKLINFEKSFWFEGEMDTIKNSTLIVGEQRIEVRWAYNGNLIYFIKAFQKLKESA